PAQDRLQAGRGRADLGTVEAEPEQVRQRRLGRRAGEAVERRVHLVVPVCQLGVLALVEGAEPRQAALGLGERPCGDSRAERGLQDEELRADTREEILEVLAE